MECCADGRGSRWRWPLVVALIALAAVALALLADDAPFPARSKHSLASHAARVGPSASAGAGAPGTATSSAADAAVAATATVAGGASSSPTRRDDLETALLGVEVVTLDGAPVAGALVTCRWYVSGGGRDESDPAPPPSRFDERSARTDARGCCQLLGPDRAVEVQARAPGLVSGLEVVRFCSHSMRLVLLPALELSGVVVDRAGAPVDASIEVDDLGPVSYPGGRFHITDLPERELSLTVRADGFAQRTLQRVPEKGGEATRVVLDRLVILEGTIAFTDGAPMCEGRVWIVDDGGWGPHGPPRVRVWLDGRFDLEWPLHEGSLELRASGHDDRGREGQARARVELLPPAVRAPLQLTPPAFGTLRVRVEAAAPPEELTLDLHPGPEEFLAADGTFEDAVEPGPVELVLRGRSLRAPLATRVAEVRAGEVTEVTLAGGGGALSGTVAGAPEGQPTRVVLWRGGQLLGEVELDAGGCFRVEGVPAGALQVFARCVPQPVGGTWLGASADVDVGDGTRREAHLRLGHTGALSGTLVDASDQPIRAARVQVEDPGREASVAISDDHGQFAFEGVVPGRRRVWVGDDATLGRVARRRGVRATICPAVEVDVRPGDTSEVTLRVVDAP